MQTSGWYESALSLPRQIRDIERPRACLMPPSNVCCIPGGCTRATDRLTRRTHYRSPLHDLDHSGQKLPDLNDL